MTLREDAIAAKRAANIAESSLLGGPAPTPWTGSPVFDEDRAAALRSLRRIQSVALEVIEGTETGGH